jgi:V/A-type H+/Na+-transporting ATPase subunit E
MENKLQELTNKIYTEGVDKAKKEADGHHCKGKKPNGMQKNAEKEAESIIENAEKEAHGKLKIMFIPR